MDPSIAAVLTAALSALVVILGWTVAHRLNVQRDTLVKRRDLRVQYLLDAYRRLEDAAGRDTSEGFPEAKRAFESAVADIQLLGTKAQIEALLAYLRQLKDSRGTVDPVLKLIRDDLRSELNLEKDIPQIHQFRFKDETKLQ